MFTISLFNHPRDRWPQTYPLQLSRNASIIARAMHKHYTEQPKSESQSTPDTFRALFWQFLQTFHFIFFGNVLIFSLTTTSTTYHVQYSIHNEHTLSLSGAQSDATACVCQLLAMCMCVKVELVWCVRDECVNVRDRRETLASHKAIINP